MVEATERFTAKTVGASFRDITPLMAEKWLSQIPDYQRRIDPKQVAKLVMAIYKNEWRENGATIVFNEKGDLIDGQHRLTAIAQAGKTVRSLVVMGLSSDESTFQTIGDEKPRKVQDFMRCKNVAVVAATVRYYWSLLNGVWPVGHGGAKKAPIIDMMKLVKKWEPTINPLIEPLRLAGRITGQHSFCVFLVFYYTQIHNGPKINEARLSEYFATSRIRLAVR